MNVNAKGLESVDLTYPLLFVIKVRFFVGYLIDSSCAK